MSLFKRATYDRAKFSPIYLETVKIMSENPKANFVFITDEINARGFKKRTGNDYKVEDIIRTYRIWSRREKQVQMIEAKRKYRE